jgi:hypothetical protein
LTSPGGFSTRLSVTGSMTIRDPSCVTAIRVPGLIPSAERISSLQDIGEEDKIRLTSQSRNCMVTNYAKPFGYIFSCRKCPSHVPSPRRSHAPRGARPVAARQPARGKHRQCISAVTPGNIEASAAAARRSARARTSERAPSCLSAPSRAAARGRFVARTLSQLLGAQPLEPEKFRRIGIC